MRCPYDVVQLQFVCARYRAVEVWKVTIAPKPASLGTASPLRHKTQPMLVRRPWIISTPQESNRFLTLQPSSVATRKRLSRLQSTSASWSGFGSPNKPDPVWVDTHKGVPVLIAESKPTNPCKVCLGRGKVVCGTCDGKGTSQVCTAASVSAAATSVITMSAPSQQLTCHQKCCLCCCKQCWHLQCGSVHVAKRQLSTLCHRQNKRITAQNAAKWDVAQMVFQLQGQRPVVLPKVRRCIVVLCGSASKVVQTLRTAVVASYGG